MPRRGGTRDYQFRAGMRILEVQTAVPSINTP
jgi:hypothetical protein